MSTSTLSPKFAAMPSNGTFENSLMILDATGYVILQKKKGKEKIYTFLFAMMAQRKATFPLAFHSPLSTYLSRAGCRMKYRRQIIFLLLSSSLSSFVKSGQRALCSICCPCLLSASVATSSEADIIQGRHDSLPPRSDSAKTVAERRLADGQFYQLPSVFTHVGGDDRTVYNGAKVVQNLRQEEQPPAPQDFLRLQYRFALRFRRGLARLACG